ncbi:MAG: acetyl-CoA carboxylase biotin carboxyl carrier protein [Acidobacteriaceae bacterium]|nr:acetyl-CoA carboxylase biotin carboxyl carrier protein [Acidobacteriaceae bacterium]
MTIDEIKELIRVVQETGVAELEVRRGDNSVRIKRSTGTTQEVVLPAVLPVPVTSVTPSGPTIVASPLQESLPPATAPSQPPPAEESRDAVVKSPIVGTYYDAPSPGVAPFVKVGDRVEQKQVLCIIESMKLMNEIEAETAGTLVAKHVENGRPVEYGESLFTIRPF